MQTVRRLRWSDAWFCYKLAKDPAVRKASLDSRSPTFFGHLRWMRRWICDKDRIAWIIKAPLKVSLDIAGEFDHGDHYATFTMEDRVGLIRFDRSTCEIGIAIIPKARNQGVALETLLSASPYFHREGGALYAVIKKGNRASLSLFRKAGYRRLIIGAENTMEWRPEYG